MRVEDIFEFIDNVLGLKRLSNIIVLLTSSILVFSASLYILCMATRRQVGIEHAVEDNRRFKLFIALYACTVLLMVFGLVQSLIEYYISSSLIIALIIYIDILMLTYIWFNGTKEFPFLFLFFTSSLLFTHFFSSKAVLNGVDSTETMADTLQIYYEGSFRFSRHAGWYDWAPVDAIMKIFLLNILGVSDPYDPTVTTLMYSALSISILTYIFAFVKNFRGNFIKNSIIAILLLVVHPYSLLVGMSTPPTNFSLVFSLFAIMLASRIIYNIGSSATNRVLILLFIIFAAQAVLAHLKSIIIPIYLLTFSIYLKMSRMNDKPVKYIGFLVLISIVLFLLKSVYPPVLSGILGLVNVIVEGITTFLFGGWSRDIIVYQGGPPPPKSTLFSFAAFPGFMTAIFFIEFIRVYKGEKGDMFSVLVLSVVLILSLVAVVTNLVKPQSRYLGYPSIVLGSFQCLIYLSRMPIHSKWKYALVIMLGIMCLTSIFSPNAMVEHYNVFTGGRRPRVENFVLSSYLLNNVDPEYVVKVFYKLEKARLNLYFTPDILYYGHPYHHINILLVEKFLISGLIDARSYWDFTGEKSFAKYAGSIVMLDALNESIVFNGWKWVMTWK